MVIDESTIMKIGAAIHSLNYADAARMQFIVMYGDRHVPEFNCERDDEGNVQLNIYMRSEVCCRIEKIIPCEDVLSAKNPVKVIYKALEDMHKLLTMYEEHKTWRKI